MIMRTVADIKNMGVKAAYISGGGEPTTLRGWEYYAEELVNGGIEVALITNSIAIKPEHYELLRRFNYIAVSVYSTDEDQYKKIVGSNHFVRQFELPKKVKTSSSNLIVGARCVINGINYQKIFDVYKKAMDEGFDYIIFIPAVDYERRRIDLTEEQKESVLEQIQRGVDEINPSTTNLLNVQKNKIGHYSKEYLPNLQKNFICSAIEIRSNAFINYDGEVYLCQPLIGQSEYSLGNINETSFAQLWNGHRHKELIKRLNDKFAKGKCENCRAIAYNLSIDRYTCGILPEIIPRDNFL